MKAVIAKDSERVNATNVRPCLEAGLNLPVHRKLMTTPSLIVRTCDLLMVIAKPATNGNCVLVPFVFFANSSIARMGTNFLHCSPG